MASRKLLTIFGATGNQGGSVIDIVLGHPDLQEKYRLRGITRDPSSSKSQALFAKGVEMVKAELDDVDSIKAAVRGAYGVFGVTDFWSVMSKDVEIRQGKNIFEACKAEDVKHLVFSALLSVTEMTNGKYKRVDHFDSKAAVMEHIEANKGDMIASYSMPAMFIDYFKNAVRVVDGKPTISMPFASDTTAWPLIQPRRDNGKYVMGLFEGGREANGVKVNAVSTWTTAHDIVAALSKESGQDVVFKAVSGETFAGFLPKPVAIELTEMMQMIGEFSYYGKDTEKHQAEHDKWLIPGPKPISFDQWAKENGPWKFQ